jgi:hypothetical protein
MASQIARAHICNGILLDGQAIARDALSLRFSPRPVAVPLNPYSSELIMVTDTLVQATTYRPRAALMRLGYSFLPAHSAIRWISFMSWLGIEHPNVIRVACKQVHARVAIEMEIADLRPHPDFVLEVQSVFRVPGDAQLDALRDVLKRWGSVIATRVELGCALMSTTVFALPCRIPAVRGI